jgi:hypothetical protein
LLPANDNRSGKNRLQAAGKRYFIGKLKHWSGLQAIYGW